tara:strand:- start:241 stop:618 length:378 start_codon:yes stop_codon:yes gene_type:complete
MIKKTIKINKKIKDVLMTKVETFESIDFLENINNMNVNVCNNSVIDDIEELEDKISKSLLSLNAREERTLRMRFGIKMKKDMSLGQVANFFNLSNERVRQIEAKALRKLKHPVVSKKLKHLLEVA